MWEGDALMGVCPHCWGPFPVQIFVANASINNKKKKDEKGELGGGQGVEQRRKLLH